MESLTDFIVTFGLFWFIQYFIVAAGNEIYILLLIKVCMDQVDGNFRNFDFNRVIISMLLIIYRRLNYPIFVNNPMVDYIAVQNSRDCRAD